MSQFGMYLGLGVTVQYDFGTTRKLQQYYARFLFIYFEQTVVQINKKIHQDVKILKIILNYNIINIKSAVHIHTRNKYLKYI